ncbi:hypothetical protein KM043_009806 [Ampulex compressa]|nr:hypothetical protein KM043_009806 [Ampulex compressa]
MELMRMILGNRILKLTAPGLVYLWNKGQRHPVLTISFLAAGGAYFLFSSKRREKISSKQLIVITGCDSGLGYSLALHCRGLGATIVAGVLQNEGAGARKLRDNDVIVHPLNITDSRSVQDFRRAVETLARKENLILLSLINNAGVMVFGEFEWQTEDQIRDQVEVNFLGTMRVTREFMPIIRTHLSRIILVSSHCTTEPLPGVAAYGATKAAINAWATAIRVELKKYGVKVLCFVPGSFTSESNILAQQGKHFEAMRISMSEEAREFYGDYFDRYAQYFRPMAQEILPKKLGNPRVYEIFEGALLDKYPSAVYKCEPWRYFFYHTLVKLSPRCIRDLMIERFVQLPQWNGDIVDKRKAVSFVLAAFCFAASHQSTPFTPCESGPVPLDLRIDGCTAQPCPLYKGTNLTAQWDFTVVSNTAALKPRVVATVMGARVNYPFPQKNACTTLVNGECPLDKDEEVTYALTMPILKYYPSIPLNIEFALLGDDGKEQVCFKVDAKVQKRP